ncbi:DNA polymerase II large subunit [Natranaeroarchaeum aerophilus]|uniref:DNA polymerase II large subunit n=1 Tax=Natranaeroarchaeum aerophilus TaxID=2917711 RepID=A0AAE3K2Z9_9EURY|nr:DNA polymerase II large subunit [Natranaeroarchaeum aerophilus]MCL9812128.1 DNA polymerase II large subunit [Natranaeroarchaeum aerophilus]
MRDEDERYFDRLETELDAAMDVASEAKARGGDPKPEVEIPIARDMADRVENILGIDGVAERVRELEGEMSREEAALELVTDFVEGRVGEYDSRDGKIEGAVRTAVALLTEGVVAAPIEGIDRVEINENDDGTEFVAVYYAGPIRSAGGTAQALSVLVADYARSLLDVDEFKPRDDEVERYAEEVGLYDKETGLQYSPKDKETKFITRNCPIMLDGEATGEEEVSGFRDLERIETNSARGGMCLVLAEGIALKAPKIKRYTRNLEEVDWPWLDDLMDGTIGKDDGDADEGDEDESEDEDGGEAGADKADEPAEREGPPRAEPNGKFLRDLIAGRPVFSHPSEEGGFRLHYGRARNHGNATAGVHPATMHLVDDFLATGTQIKTELPGKAAGVVPVDTIEGPTVRLANGEVRQIDDPAEAIEIRNGVEKVLDVGEYLVNYGEFVENNHQLVPAGYTVEWWVQEFEAAGADVQAMRDDPGVDLADPDPEEALDWATEYDAPLHPNHTCLWHDIDVEAFEALVAAVEDGTVDADVPAIEHKSVEPSILDVLVLPRSETVREAIEALLLEHTQTDTTLRIPVWRPFVRSLGFAVDGEDLTRTWDELSADARSWPNAVEAVNEVAPFTVRERSPTRVGNRMGRPEKSESRELSPAVHTLFPIGEAGGTQRNVADAAKHADSMTDTPGEVEVEVGRRECVDCGEHTFKTRCPECNGHTEPHYECPDCESRLYPDESGRVYCDHCEVEGTSVETRVVDVHAEYRNALESVGERENAFEMLKGVKGLSSHNKTPEPMEKGVFRAKHGVSSFKDGTVRYDMTDLPITSVRASELDVTVDQLRGLGYQEDIHGEALTHEDQLVELKVQDVVLSDGAAEHMLKTADFVDDLLESYYGLDPYYEVEDREELVGELVFGMAPHTSAATVGRVIGFTSAAVGYAHPFFHAAKRRNCFHPETEITYRSPDGEWERVEIEQFVEERLDEPRTDDFGTLVEELDQPLYVPSMDEDGQSTEQRIATISKHPSPNHLIKIQTTSGKQLRVTPDHSMLRWEDGVQRVPASQIEVGDSIPTRSTGPADRTASTQAVSADGGQTDTETVERVEISESDVEHTYCLTVEQTNTLEANKLLSGQCDGDEDCVMLLMDGLLNFSKTYLPDQRGGSVAENSRLVATDPTGNVRFLTFEEFWNRLDSPIEYDGKFRKKTCRSEGWKTYAFDNNHDASLQPIEKAIRYETDEELLRIETQFGRSLELTKHHSLFRYGENGIEEIAGAELSEGDLVVAPQQLDIEPTETTIDVTECVEKPYVVIDDHVEDLLTTIWETTERGGPEHRAFDSGLSYRLSRRKISWEQFTTILDTAGYEIPTDLKIGFEGSTDGIAREIDIDEDFAWLLGLYVAEGSRSSVCPTIHNSDEDVIDHAADIIESTLGHEPERRWSNRSYELRFPAVFRAVLTDLGLGAHDSYSSSEKTVPECIRNAPLDTARAFLRGFITGDGSDSTDDNCTTVAFHTTSEDVKDGMVFLLHRFGLVANISYQENRPGNRQPIYAVTVSGGATDNPLHRVLNGKQPYQPKSLVVAIPEALRELREMEIRDIKEIIPKYLKRRSNISLAKLTEIFEELNSRSLPAAAESKIEDLRPLVNGDLSYLKIQSVDTVDYNGYLYDLQVGGEPIFTANWLYAHNSMDAPLVMSSRIDPAEIDDEAHNIDVVDEYPLEFYEAAREMVDPEDVDIEIAEATLGTDREYTDFGHTHDTANIALGPDLSAYKTLGSMMDKMDAQLEISRKLRAVDETDVAERVIEYHFLPDLIGNLRAFSRQETRCLDCGEKYRRMPLSRECRECGGRVNLTVHEGSVNKYMQTAITVADEFGSRDYTKQRLEVLEMKLESIFEDDTNKQSGIADFM